MSASSSGDAPSNPADVSGMVIRQARAADLGAILDLLTEYDLPRAHFEPFYYHDPIYEPAHSWLAELDGRLAAHLRVYDRWIRVGGARLRIAGVGNVITARAYRGRGLAGRLLQEMLAGVRTQGFAYSLLWTHVPGLYARYGWAPIEQRLVEATLPPPGPSALRLAPFQPADLPAVMQLYDSTNAARSGPVLRSSEYWRGQLRWLDEAPDGFLLARTAAGELQGYVRTRRSAAVTEILELSLPPAALKAGRALLGAAAADTGRRAQGHLPRSLEILLAAGEQQVISETGLMGRVVDLGAVLRALEPRWRHGPEGTTMPPGTLALVTSGGCAEIEARAAGLRVHLRDTVAAERALNEQEVAHLLFHGFDDTAGELVGEGPERPLLQALFPAQDFVFWQADAF